MEQKLTLHGVPHALQRDAWWLASQTPDIGQGGGSPDTPAPRILEKASRFLGLGLLVALADILFWDRAAGLSLAIFAGAVFFAGTMTIKPRRALLWPSVLLGLGCLPVVEFVQPLSVAVLLASLVTALAWARMPDFSPKTLPSVTLGLLCALPKRLPRPVLRFAAVDLRAIAPLQSARTALRNWAFPLGGGLVFTALLLQANPVLSGLFDMRLDTGELIIRSLFWAGVGILTFPFLDPAPAKATVPNLDELPDLPGLSALGINAGSCLRALWTFNALIGLQTLMDLSIFMGGATLPDGMSYASYAHRGAYPLLATALLAGGFALAAKPFLDEHRSLKPLMYLWLAQNVALCASAILRLDLYVQAYGLTYMRIYAVIWMALVAAGLALVFWQILRNHNNTWLLVRGATVTAATLYICCFVNFAELIVSQNLTMQDPDFDYICGLNPSARGVLGHAQANGLATNCPINLSDPRAHWQEWGLRNWRTGLYDPTW